MAIPWSSTFDGGVDGATVATGGPITARTGTPTYTTDAAHGDRAARFLGPTASTCLRYDTGSTASHSGRAYIKVPAIPSTHIRLFSWGDLANTVTAFNIRLHNSGKIDLADATTVSKKTGLVSYNVNSYFRMEWQVNNADPSNPVLTVRIFNSMESTTVSEEISWTFAGTTVALDRINVGVVGSAAAGNTREVVVDSFDTVTGLTWMGPKNPPAVAADYIKAGPYVMRHSGSGQTTSMKWTPPKCMAAGDLMVAAIELSAVQAPDPTFPAGWTLAGADVLNPSNATAAIIYKFAAAGDLNAEKTISWTTLTKYSFLMKIYSGVDAATGIHAFAAELKSGATNTHPCPALVTTADAWRINIVSLKASTINDLQPPSGNVMRGAVYGLGGSGNAIGFSDSGANVTLGSQPAQNWTSDLAAGSGMVATLMLKSVAADPARVFYAHTDFVTIGAALQTSIGLTWCGNGATALSLKYSINADMSSPVTVPGTTTPDAGGYAHFAVSGLSAETQYYFQVFDTPAGGSPTATSDILKARTLPPSGIPQDFTLAHGACQTNESAVSTALDNMRTYNADVNFHLGDFHYYNPDDSSQVLHERRYWSQIMNAAGTRNFVQGLAFNLVGSDHDRGPSNDNGDSNLPFNEFSIKAAANVFPHQVLGDTVTTPTRGLYYSFVVGRVRFICVDVRNSDRSPGLDPQTSAKTMLGATQKAWLKDRLLDPEPVKVIVSDEGWNHPATTASDRAAWWSYDNERTEIGEFIAANGVRVFFIHGNDHKIACDDGTNNAWGGFPVVCAAPFDNVGGGVSVMQQEYSTDINTRGSQYGRLAVSDDGDKITFAWQGWDALTNTQKIAMTVEWDIPTYEGPQIFTGAGNITTGNAVSPATNVTASKPANLADNEQLIAVVFNRTYHNNGFTAVPAGFDLIGRSDSTYNFAAYIKNVEAVSDEPANYTFTAAAGGRTELVLIRASNIHPDSPIDVLGTLAGVTGTDNIVMPGVDPGTSNTLLIGVAAAGRSNASPPLFFAPSGMQLAVNGSVVDGASSSDVGVFYEQRLPDTATGSRTAAIAPVAANSVGFMFALRAATSPVPPSASHMVVGGVTSSKAIVRAKVNGTFPVRLAMYTDAGMTSPDYSAVGTADADGYVELVYNGLTQNTPYWYKLELDGVLFDDLTGKFRSMPLEGAQTSFSFAAASCAVTNSNDTIFDSIRTRPGPDGLPARFFAHLGDWEYVWSGVTAPNDHAQLLAAIETVFDQSRQAQLYREMPLNYGESDVDFGGSNSDGTWAGAATWQALYRQVYPTYPLPSTEGGVFKAFTVGRVRFIHTDGRSLSSPKGATDNASKSMLGLQQKAWLKNELLRGEPVKIWFHDNEWVGSPLLPDGNVDQWRVYNTERQEIADFITANDITNLIYICGDTHTLMADDGTNNPYGGFARICVAPMHQQANTTAFVNSHGAFPTAGTVTTAHQYGWFDVADEGATITVSFTGYDGDGTERISMDKTFDVPTDRSGRPKIEMGSGFESKPLKVWMGSQWVEKKVKVADGVGGFIIAR